MAKTKTKNLVYINNYAAFFANESHILKKLLSNKIGHKRWISLSEISLPAELRSISSTVMNENFYHGIASQQYMLISQGGTFINPLIYGLKIDFKMWNDMLHTNADFNQEVVYIDIPYDIYCEIDKFDENPVSAENYEKNSVYMRSVVDTLKHTYYTSDTQLH